MSNFSNELTIFIPAIGGNGGVDIIPPSNPLNVMGSPMPTSVSLTWEQPVFNVNLTSYLARCIAMNGNSDVNQSTISTETNVTVEGLMPETLYTCHVISVADTIQGGSMSVQITTTTPMLMMPMNVTATATSPTMINVQWEHPPFMNTIDHYFVSWEPFGLPPAVTLVGGMMEINCVSANTPVLGTTNCTDVMEFNITGLEEYVNYTVMVIASNDVGNSTSGTDTALTLPAVPAAEPMNLTAVNIEAFYVSIQWEGLNFLDRNGPDFSYNVSYNVQGSSDGGSVAVNQNSTVIMGLKGFTTYEITVAGQNSVGLGPLSDPLTVTTIEGTSSQPINLTSTSVTDTTIDLLWVEPECPNGVIEHYVVMYNGVAVNTTDNSTMFTLPGLEPFTNYTIIVAARNGAGVGNVSETIVVQTDEGEPTPPRNLTGGNTGIMSAVLQWLEPLDPNGIILYYVVYYSYYSEGMTFQMSSASSQHFPPDITTTRNDFPDGISFLTALPSRLHYSTDLITLFQYILHFRSGC
jgi:hypothetical protein